MALFATTVAAILAAAAAAPARQVTPPAALVRDHRVTHPREHVIISVPAAATYVGSDRFDLYGIADAEVHLFVEAGTTKRVKTLYWIQFEHYWPDKPDMTHDYTGDRREQHWGTTVWVRGEPSDPSRPTKRGSDTEHVRAGYTPPVALMNVRMVQLLDDPQGTGHGRDELMFIYSEDLAQSGKALAELTSEGRPNANWVPIEKGLVERAKKAFSVERK